MQLYLWDQKYKRKFDPLFKGIVCDMIWQGTISSPFVRIELTKHVQEFAEGGIFPWLGKTKIK